MKNYPVEELTIDEYNQFIRRINYRISNRWVIKAEPFIITDVKRDLVKVSVEKKSDSQPWAKRNRYKR